MQKIKTYISFLLLLPLLAGLLVGCGTAESGVFREAADFEKARIGVMTGSSFDLLATEYYPEAEKLYYMNNADLILNLKQAKIDGILMDKGFFAPLQWEDKDLTSIEMDMPAVEFSVAFSKTAESEPLRAQINEFIQQQTQNGWLDELKAKWFSASEPDGYNDLAQLTGENGTLRRPESAL